MVPNSHPRFGSIWYIQYFYVNNFLIQRPQTRHGPQLFYIIVVDLVSDGKLCCELIGDLQLSTIGFA
jgi:hypothetical protein